MIRPTFLLLLCLAAVAPAQSPVAIGVSIKGGLNTGNWFGGAEPESHGTATDQSSNFTGGPAVELRFLNRVGLEADALYRKIGLDSSGGIAGAGWSNTERGTLWEFPVLGKVRLGRVARFRPFLAAGVTFHRLRSDIDYTRENPMPQPDGSVVTVRTTGTRSVSENGKGATFAAGLERPFGRWRFSLEGRFTHLGTGPSPCYDRCRNQDRFTVLVGLGF